MTRDIVWTVKSALDWCRTYLAERGDEHPRLSAEWLLSAATGLSRVELYTQHERPLSPAELASLGGFVRRRAAGEPLQYVTGEVAFRHLVVRVRQGVLIPRPETEVLVDCVLDTLGARDEPLVADICTGTGVVALSVAHEHAGATVWATDISPEAIACAADNARRLGLDKRVRLLEGDLLAPLPAHLRGRLDVVVANPPYVPSAEVGGLAPEISGHEPHLALDGGPDGLDIFRRLARDASTWLAPDGLLAVELDERMVRRAAEEALKWYQDLKVVRDLAGRDRIVMASAPVDDPGTDDKTEETDHVKGLPS